MGLTGFFRAFVTKGMNADAKQKELVKQAQRQLIENAFEQMKQNLMAQGYTEEQAELFVDYAKDYYNV